MIVHIEELTSGDFREGTNHGRARDRLVALSNLLPGDIAEVKEQQFRIGYEIERFEGLIAAYRSGGDDMPVLNAAALEDLDRLRIALDGVDKPERWADSAAWRPTIRGMSGRQTGSRGRCARPDGGKDGEEIRVFPPRTTRIVPLPRRSRQRPGRRPRLSSMVPLTQLSLLAPSGDDFGGVKAQESESHQRGALATRL